LRRFGLLEKGGGFAGGNSKVPGFFGVGQGCVPSISKQFFAECWFVAVSPYRSAYMPRICGM
jgi:hypothetical protein